MLNRDKKNSAGCKPHDVVLMFKILLLKRFYNLSDEQVEYQIYECWGTRQSANREVAQRDSNGGQDL